MSCPHPTPQYGQIERATCASSIRACIARVLSDIASRPVPSVRSRICRTSGHLESKLVSDVMSVRLTNFHCYFFMWISQRKHFALDQATRLSMNCLLPLAVQLRHDRIIELDQSRRRVLLQMID